MSNIQALKEWFLQRKRSFPWRKNPSPYAVWVSEIMLQQTRANVVVGYFTKWMEKFPTISSLATAPLSEALKAWEGLGYYSRVRNLKAAAEYLYEKKEDIPSTLNGLLSIKGVGLYTAGAILSFAFHQKAVAVDANVARVVARFFEIKGDLSSVKEKKEVESKTLSLLPEEEPWIVMEALIELGAIVCTKVPRCVSCPMSSGCLSYLRGTVDMIPLKKKRKETIYLHKQVFLILCENEVLVEVKTEGRVLGGLVEFPSFPYESEGGAENQIKDLLGIEVEWVADLKEEKQSFTRYQVDLSPAVFTVSLKKEVPGFLWKKREDLQLLTFSSGHKRILQQLLRL